MYNKEEKIQQNRIKFNNNNNSSNHIFLRVIMMRMMRFKR